MHLRVPIEVLFTAALACVALVIARLYELPFVTPSRAALAAVGEKMKGVGRKNRVTVYYLLAEHAGKLSLFG